MNKKYLVMCFAILGLLLMALSIFGCAGYQAPKYKAPEGQAEDEWMELDVNDLEEPDLEKPKDDDLFDDEFWQEDAEEPADVAEEMMQEPAEEPVGVYQPAKTEEPVKKTEEDDFKKSPYRAVVEEDLPTITVTEGEVVKLSVKATDADGDSLEYDFDEPLDRDGEWQTAKGDAGVYYPEVTVSDGKDTVTKKIKIIVELDNNKPVLAFIPDVVVDEGDTVKLIADASDVDGDELEVKFTGWMTTDTRVTDFSDAGEHKVTVSVTDGLATVSQEVTILVNDVNRAPEVEIEF